MTTATGSYVCDNSTLTNFKSWAQAISGAFTTMGWAQTTDTGQVNWGTIATVPSSAYVSEIWKTADALSSTLPIFIKIGYGFSTTNPRIQITVGQGSDGSGNITGTTISSSPWVITGTAMTNQSSTTFPCYFSGSTGEFRMYMWSSSTGTLAIQTVFGIERSKSALGADTSDYFTVISAGGQNGGPTIFQQSIKSASVGVRDTCWMAIPGSTGSNTGAAFGTVTALPIFPVLGLVGNPFLGWMSAYGADVTNGASVTVSSMYGSTHTYVGCTNATATTGIQGAIANKASIGAIMTILMRYE